MAEEICHRANIDGGIPTDGLSDLEKLHLAHTFLSLIEDIKMRLSLLILYIRGESL